MSAWHMENNFPVLPFVQCCSTCTSQCHVDGVCKANADKHEGIDLTVRFILTFGDLFLVILTFCVIMDHPFSTYTYQGVKNVGFSERFAYLPNGWSSKKLYFSLVNGYCQFGQWW